MTISQAVILGIVEGVTEFLPVSSTFHLIWASTILGIKQTDFQKLFEVTIQSGAILAVLIPFTQAIKKDFSLLKKIITAFIPTGILGLALYGLVKKIFFIDTQLQLIVFVIVGILFIVFEYKRKSPYTKSITSITYREAAFVGTIQALAIIPGISRAGAVILALMALSYKREEAARFSFFLAIPTILSASIYDLYKSSAVIKSGNDYVILTIGFIVAFVTACIVVHWFIAYLSRHTISVFGWYRIIIVVLIITLFQLR